MEIKIESNSDLTSRIEKLIKSGDPVNAGALLGLAEFNLERKLNTGRQFHDGKIYNVFLGYMRAMTDSDICQDIGNLIKTNLANVKVLIDESDPILIDTAIKKVRQLIMTYNNEVVPSNTENIFSYSVGNGKMEFWVNFNGKYYTLSGEHRDDLPYSTEYFIDMEYDKFMPVFNGYYQILKNRLHNNDYDDSDIISDEELFYEFVKKLIKEKKFLGAPEVKDYLGNFFNEYYENEYDDDGDTEEDSILDEAEPEAPKKIDPTSDQMRKFLDMTRKLNGKK